MAANAAAAIARLGGEVELWTRVGGDDAGNAIRSALDSVGVDTTHVRTISSARSSTAAVIVDGRGERLIVGERDHAMPMDPNWLPLDQICRAGAVLSDSSWKEATLAAFGTARSLGVPTLIDIDLGAGVLRPELLRLTDYAIFSSAALGKFGHGNSREARLAGIAEYGVGHVGVTEGSGGYHWIEPDGNMRHQPAFAIDVIDTTGAGDAFHGAFAWALTHGLESARCALIATAVAALKCRRLGARSGLPTLRELEAFLVAQSHDDQ
jgi:sulfofructose kinase